MNFEDYRAGNTDRRCSNRGFWMDNRTNRLEKLRPLMDFNKAFGACDTAEGARRLTVRESISRREAAVRGVRLNQIRPLPEYQSGQPESAAWRAMLQRQPAILKKAGLR